MYPQIALWALDGTPLIQPAHEMAPESERTTSPGPDTIRLVFVMLTLRPFDFMPLFHASSWFKQYLLIYFYNNITNYTIVLWHIPPVSLPSQLGHQRRAVPNRNSRDNASNTMMKSSWLRTDPWCTPTPTQNSSLYWLLTRIQLLTLVYMAWMILTAHSSTPRLLKAHSSTFLRPRSNAFSWSTKAIYRGLLAWQRSASPAFVLSLRWWCPGQVQS
jgi:hypothetical protein